MIFAIDPHVIKQIARVGYRITSLLAPSVLAVHGNDWSDMKTGIVAREQEAKA